MATYSVPEEGGGKTPKPTFVPSKGKSIPTPVAKPSFVPNNKKGIPEDTQDPFRKSALRKKLSAHQQHMAHMNHVNHVNNLRNQGK